ncbi:MAG: acylphosphatase [Acidobacteriota bacterium]|nr:acylphosphatase [Acidobacteriota bacterium]
MTEIARRALVSGRVQGVGFRAFARRAAHDAGVKGWVRNLSDGRVETEVEGEDAAVARYLEKLRRGPLVGSVSSVAEEELPARGFQGFEIRS